MTYMLYDKKKKVNSLLWSVFRKPYIPPSLSIEWCWLFRKFKIDRNACFLNYVRKHYLFIFLHSYSCRWYLSCITDLAFRVRPVITFLPYPYICWLCIRNMSSKVFSADYGQFQKFDLKTVHEIKTRAEKSRAIHGPFKKNLLYSSTKSPQKVTQSFERHSNNTILFLYEVRQ